ncbi:MAG: type II toxin-antitoxin system HicA family toxin [Chitinophagaceae bacterium]
MKIPRDLSGADLIKYLKPYGYIVTRQSGSHVRLTTEQNGQHHITIPNHDPLKIGTLSSILNEIALHLNMNRDQILNELFG